MKIRHLISIFILAFSNLIGQGQEDYPQIGKTIPFVKFQNVLYSESSNLTIDDFKGRPLVLDFFSKNCVSCFASFPNVNKLYQKYKDSVSVLLVGIDLDDNIQDTYHKFKTKLALTLPVAYDKELYKQFKINAVPNIIWIDRNGVVQAVTNSFREEFLVPFIRGETFEFKDYSYDYINRKSGFNPEKPFLLECIGGEEPTFLHRSILTEWEIGMPSYMSYKSPPQSPLVGVEYLNILGRELADLYRVAYFERTYAWNIDDAVAYGNFLYSPVLEIKDKSKFESDYVLGNNLFCYSQLLPSEKRDITNMKMALQRDLKTTFGYDVSVEKRQMPYLRLTATKKAKKKLIAKGKKSGQTDGVEGGEFYNISINTLIHVITHSSQLVTRDLPLLNETGIKSNIDISFEANMTDFDDVVEALKQHGLIIVEGKKWMKCIVIKESRNNN